MKKLLGALIVIAILAAGGATAWAVLLPEAERVAPPTQPVTRGDIEKTVLASGTLQANSVVSVAAEVSGQVETLHVALGDRVEQGALIAEIDALDQENAVKTAEAALANILAQRRAQQAEVVKAKQALSRAEQLSGNALVSQADLETAQASLEAARAQIDALDAQISQAELSVELARLDLDRTRITAPVSGTVVAVLTGEGQTVNASQSAPTIVKIADLDTMVIKAQISEADVTKVEPGMPVSFTILGEPDNRYRATLRAIEPAPDAIETSDTGLESGENAVYYNGLFEVENPAGLLRIAMTAEVTIVTEAVEDALLVSSAALLSGPGGNSIVRVYDPATGTTSPRRVTVGLDNSLSAEIVDGLEEGEQVVTATQTTVTAQANGGGGSGQGGGIRIGPGPMMRGAGG